MSFIKGASETMKALSRLADEMEIARNNAVKEATLLVHKTAIKLVSENKNGTKQTRYNPKRRVSVSKPGSPPHTDTGHLRQSIMFNFKDGKGEVGTNEKYGAWLEFGTLDMEARPWLSTAIEQTSDEVAKIFEKHRANALKKVAK